MSGRSTRREASPAETADVLLDALPYIQRFAGKTIVIKYGGHAMIDAALQESFARDVVLLKYTGMNPVIVHGGGPQIGRMLEKLGIESRFVRGMRVTDAATMDVVEMVLVGKVNKTIVRMINQHGGRAVGLSGQDGNLIHARKLTVAGVEAGEDMGMVGTVDKVDAGLIETIGRSGYIPVIAPIGGDDRGQTFNINADLVAAHVAAALRAEKLVLLTDVEGIRGAEGTVLPSLDSETARHLIDRGVIAGGMIPKVECCLDALAAGVAKTHVIDGRVLHALLLEIFTSEGVGTEVVSEVRGQTSGEGAG